MPLVCDRSEVHRCAARALQQSELSPG
ncbi:hypothetical protein ACFPAA_19700 [Paraburkholderia caffeinitolerans]